MAKLRAEERLLAAVQHDAYVLCELAGYIDGMRLRAFLDPHVFVLQMDRECNQLEINFNPTPDQVKKLRDFTTRIKQIRLSSNNRK